MFEKFFEKYPIVEIIQKPDAKTIDSYQNRLPNEILSLWETYGWGIYMDGYLRLIDPSKFDIFVRKNIVDSGVDCIPVAFTVFGDIISWRRKNEGYLDLYDFRHCVIKVLSTSTGLDILFDMDFIDDTYIWNELNALSFQLAKDKLGVPEYDKCYGYFPLLALGGKESVDRLQIVDAQVHMELMAQVSGPL
jgi:hypothetical protein